MISFRVSTKAVAKLEGLIASMGQAWHMALGRRARQVLQKHFLENDKQPHKVDYRPDMGGRKRSHFWAGIARETQVGQVTDQCAKIVMPRRLAMQVHGGTAKSSRAGGKLAIPMIAQAYGVWPSSGLIKDLFLMVGKTGAWLGKEDGQGGVDVYYKLVSSVKIPADPDALPSEKVMTVALNDETGKYIHRKLK